MRNVRHLAAALAMTVALWGVLALSALLCYVAR